MNFNRFTTKDIFLWLGTSVIIIIVLFKIGLVKTTDKGKEIIAEKHHVLNIQEMKQKGVKAEQLKALGKGVISAKDLKDIGYTAAEMRTAAYTFDELKIAGYTVDELKKGGYTDVQ